MSESLPLQHAHDSTGESAWVEPHGLVATMIVVVAIRALVLSLGFLSVATASGRLLSEASGHPWVAWDGSHYFYIAQHGYPQAIQDDTFYNIAYFPVYPFVARVLGMVMDLPTGMVLISNACAILGFALLYLWGRQIASPRVAMLGTLLCACYPGAVFFSGGLTEGPFLLMVALALWLLHQDKFFWAALVAAIATGTRPTGIALSVIIPIFAWTRTGHLNIQKRIALFIGLGLLSILGGLLYEGFLWHRFGAWDAYIQAQYTWEKGDVVRLQASANVPRYSLQFFIDRIKHPQGWNRMMALVILAITIMGMVLPLKMNRIFLLIPLVIFLMTYIPNNGLRASSILRYEAPAAPLFMMLGMWLSGKRMRYVLLIVLGLSLIWQAYYAIQFSRGAWVG